MGDPAETQDRTERVVDDPATGATAYGDRAVAQGVRVAQGGKPKPRKKRAPAPPKDPVHVRQARALWTQLFAKDPLLSKVRIGDLKAHSARHRASRPGIGGLYAVGYEAWTNSSTEVYVAKTLFRSGGPMPRWYSKAMLAHEAEHVVQFADVKDAVPSYAAMIAAEATAYGDTLKEIEAVSPAPSEVDFHAAVTEKLAEIVAGFAGRTGVTATPAEHQQWMIDRGFLPEHPLGTQNLYVR